MSKSKSKPNNYWLYYAVTPRLEYLEQLEKAVSECLLSVHAVGCVPVRDKSKRVRVSYGS
jgi:hypothetical protein